MFDAFIVIVTPEVPFASSSEISLSAQGYSAEFNSSVTWFESFRTQPGHVTIYCVVTCTRCANPCSQSGFTTLYMKGVDPDNRVVIG